MFTSQAGRHEKTEGGEEPDVDAYEGGGEGGGKVTLAQKTVTRKKNKKRTAKSSRSTKRGSRRQEQGLVSSTRSWGTSLLWSHLLHSYKSNRTDSDGCPNRGQGTRPRSGKVQCRRAKQAQPGLDIREQSHSLPPHPLTSPPPQHKRAAPQLSIPP